MVRNSAKVFAASLFAWIVLGLPAASSAQAYRADDGQPSMSVECGSGQRAIIEQRRVDGRTRMIARCEAARRSAGRRVDRAPERTKTKTALMIAGSAATGAGVGGALKGKKGALVGAAIGGGSASIYEAVKRR